MKTIQQTTVVAAMLVTVLAVAGCKADTSDLGTLSVAELADMIQGDESLVVYDANGEAVREEFGVIPGAVLLSSSSSYNVAAELGSDKAKSLVFYCSSEMCSAAPRAARRAVEAGFQEVFVLPGGIKGWVKSGQPVDKPSVG